VASSGVDRVVVVDIRDESPSDPVDSADRVTMLPGHLEGALTTDQGRLLILNVRSTNEDVAGEDGLAIYDVPKAKLTKLLRLPTTEFEFAAGGNVLLLYFSEFQRLQAWDLKRFEKLAERDFKSDGRIMRMVMGENRSDAAVLRLLSKSDSVTLKKLNTATLTIFNNKEWEETVRSGHNTSKGDFVHYRASPDLSLIAEWCTSHSPTGVGVIVQGPTGEYKQLYEHHSETFLVPGSDNLVYTGRGHIFSVDPTKRDEYGNNSGKLESIGEIKNMVLVPARDAALVVGVNSSGEMSLFASSRTTALCSLGTFPLPEKSEDSKTTQPQAGIQIDEFTKSQFGFDQRVLLNVREKSLVLLPFSNDRIVRRTCDIDALMKAQGGEYLVVTSAPPRVAFWKDYWAYRIDTLCNEPKLNYEILAGPEGMEVDSTGIVRWKVPAGIEGRMTIKIKLSTPQKRELIHRFVVHLVDRNSANGESAKDDG
jgi:hypothetical protein